MVVVLVAGAGVVSVWGPCLSVMVDVLSPVCCGSETSPAMPSRSLRLGLAPISRGTLNPVAPHVSGDYIFCCEDVGSSDWFPIR